MRSSCPPSRRFAARAFRLVRLAAGLVAAAVVAAAPAAAARTVVIDAPALRVEQADGAQILILPEFVAESEEYTVSGAAGRFDSSTELFVATGTKDRPATLSRSGEDAFTVSAIQMISIAFEDETLRAEGEVLYHSEGMKAFGELLIVDRRSRVEQLLQELLESLPPGETREIVLGFLAGLGEEDRLILMRGDVTVERKDSTLEAAWVLFREGSTEEFISVSAPGKPLRLSIVIEDESEAEPSR